MASQRNPSSSLVPFQSGNDPPDPDPLPQIVASLQELCLTPPKEATVQLKYSPEVAQLEANHNMLLKVGYLVGQIRAIPLEPLKKALSKVWGSCFLDISQVDSNLFMAHFRSWEDLSWVWNKQPWSFGSDTFLMEWTTADEKLKPLSAYTFKSIMVTVRFYGIPMALRTEDTARKVVAEIGEPSAANPILEENLKKDPKFMSVRVKMNVTKPVQAIVNLDIDNREPLRVFVHYERIHRICTFCGLMFHNSQACPIKQRIIIQQRADAQVQLNDRYGKWITQLSYLPPEAMKDL